LLCANRTRSSHQLRPLGDHKRPAAKILNRDRLHKRQCRNLPRRLRLTLKSRSSRGVLIQYDCGVRDQAHAGSDMCLYRPLECNLDLEDAQRGLYHERHGTSHSGILEARMRETFSLKLFFNGIKIIPLRTLLCYDFIRICSNLGYARPLLIGNTFVRYRDRCTPHISHSSSGP